MKKTINSRKLLFENMAKLNPDFKMRVDKPVKEMLKEEEDKWIQNAVNPKHKGYCTPMTKATCTPARKALAKRFKKGIENEAYGTPDPLGKNMAKQLNEEIPLETQGAPVKYRAEVTGTRENVWSTNAMEYDTEEEAKEWLKGLSGRWFGYDMSRVVPTSVPKGQPVDMENDVIFQNFRG
jgi:hypothetical protein